MADALEIVVRVLGDTASLAASLKGTTPTIDAFGKSIDVGMIGKVAAVAGVAGLAANALIDMTSAAAADRDEQNKLSAAIEAAGAATATSNAQVEAAIAAGQERAFTDSQTREALQSLVTTTGDVTAATGLLATAQDVARFANVDLATAADAVAKANEGQDGALRKLIPGLEKGATATDTIANAQKVAAGQADLYAKSTEGQMARASDAFGELGETIGSALLPILDALIPALIPVIQAIAKIVTALLPVLIPLIQTVARVLSIVANVIANVANAIADFVTWLMRAIDAAGKFLDSINPLKGISLPSLPFLSSSAAGLPTGLGRSIPGQFASDPFARSGGTVINVYTTGDSMEAEQAVMRALRRDRRLNGGVVPALAGWTGNV